MVKQEQRYPIARIWASLAQVIQGLSRPVLVFHPHEPSQEPGMVTQPQPTEPYGGLVLELLTTTAVEQYHSHGVYLVTFPFLATTAAQQSPTGLYTGQATKRGTGACRARPAEIHKALAHQATPQFLATLAVQQRKTLLSTGQVIAPGTGYRKAVRSMLQASVCQVIFQQCQPCPIQYCIA